MLSHRLHQRPSVRNEFLSPIHVYALSHSNTKMFFLAHISLKDIRPHSDANFAKVGFAEQEHGYAVNDSQSPF
jgi:hypothetical protein